MLSLLEEGMLEIDTTGGLRGAPQRALSSAACIETLGTPKFHIAFREHLLSVCGADYFALYHSSDGQLQNISAGGLREGSVASKQARLYAERSEEHTSELPSLMSISSAVFCLKKKTTTKTKKKT